MLKKLISSKGKYPANGTSFHHDYVVTTADELTNHFWQADRDLDKSNYFWKFDAEDLRGRFVFTVYDYRSYINSDTVYEFHIGAHNKTNSARALRLLKEEGFEVLDKESALERRKLQWGI